MDWPFAQANSKNDVMQTNIFPMESRYLEIADE